MKMLESSVTCHSFKDIRCACSNLKSYVQVSWYMISFSTQFAHFNLGSCIRIILFSIISRNVHYIFTLKLTFRLINTQEIRLTWSFLWNLWIFPGLIFALSLILLKNCSERQKVARGCYKLTRKSCSERQQLPNKLRTGLAPDEHETKTLLYNVNQLIDQSKLYFVTVIPSGFKKETNDWYIIIYQFNHTLIIVMWCVGIVVRVQSINQSINQQLYLSV